MYTEIICNTPRETIKIPAFLQMNHIHTYRISDYLLLFIYAMHSMYVYDVLSKNVLFSLFPSRFSNSKTFDEHTVFPVSESHAIMSHPKFDHNKKTVLYIHGYVEAPSHQSVHAIVEAYLTRDDYNCLVLDWAELADGNFFIDAVPNIKQVSKISPDTIVATFKVPLENDVNLRRFIIIIVSFIVFYLSILRMLCCL